MNKYRQLTSEERHTLSTLRKQGYQQAAIARVLGRHRSTISREVRCNSKDRGGRVYRPDLADDYARWRRGRSRRNRRFEAEDWALVLIGLQAGSNRTISPSNSKDRGGRVYRPDLADDYARWRRGRSRRNRRFEAEDWALVLIGLKQQWSPEQISGWLRRKGRLSIRDDLSLHLAGPATRRRALSSPSRITEAET